MTDTEETEVAQFGPGREFFSQWHRDRYLEDCEREAAGAQRRIEELQATPTDTEALEKTAGEMRENALNEIRRLTGQRAAAKRPAGGGKQARA